MLVVGAFAGVFLGYFVVKTTPGGIGLLDGLGRSLEPAPFLARFFLGQDRMWAGWGWWAIDMFWFWGSMALAFFLFSAAQRKQ